MISSSQARQLIQSNFPAAPVPSLPQIVLHRAGPRSGLWRLAEMDEDFGVPYWAFSWGGGLALASHILNCPGLVVGRTVLDLGAGSGIVGIAAAKSGAKRVIAADIDPWAIAATSLNAALNAVAISAILGDPTTGSPPDLEVILVGDLFYAEDLARRVTAFLDRCSESNIEVLVGDPMRRFLPRSRLQPLAVYPGPDFGPDFENGNRAEPRRNAVFSFTTTPSPADACNA